MSDNVNPNSSGGTDWDEWDTWGSDTAQSESSESVEQGSEGQFMDSTESWVVSDESSASDDWDISDEPSGQFMNESDGWDNLEDNSPQPQSQDWGSYDTPMEQSQNMNPIQEVQPKQFNFSKKTVGFILAGALVVLALIFAFFDGIKINKKDDGQQQQQQQVNQEQQEQQQPSAPSSGQQSVNQVDGSVTLIEIPVTTALNYSGDIYETSGTVLTKTKYVQGHQVLYCITIRVAVGSSVEDVNYYCNYASYNAVKVGDLLIVKYQQVDDNYISVNEVLK